MKGNLAPRTFFTRSSLQRHIKDDTHSEQVGSELCGIGISVSNGNRPELSSIRSVIIQVITQSDDCAARVRFVYHEYAGLD